MKTLLLLLLLSATLQAQRLLTDGYYAIVKDGIIIKDSCSTNGRPIIIDSNIEEVGGTIITGATWTDFKYKRDVYEGITHDSIYAIKFNYKGHKFTVGVLNVNYDIKEASLAVRELRADGWYKAILVANNAILIEGKGDFDHIYDLSENKKVKNSDIIKSIISMRYDDGTLEAKMKKIK